MISNFLAKTFFGIPIFNYLYIWVHSVKVRECWQQAFMQMSAAPY